jgi:hypothetical protein
MHLFLLNSAVVFKRYYTVMCLTSHLFFAIPAVSYFISHPSIVLRVVPASGLSSLNSTPLIALSLCHCCASSQSFENYLHFLHRFVGLMAHSAICSILSILTYLLVTFNGEYYWHYFFVQFQRLILNSYHS